MAAVGLLNKRVARTQGAGKARHSEQIDLYEMANLYPRETGLPMTVWVSPRGRARHAARIKVCRQPGDRMIPTDTVTDTVTVSVRILPKPTVVAGELGAADLAKVAAWIAANHTALVDYWNGTIGTGEMASQLRRV